ncbi:MAG: hypothetical protein JW795_17820 [Chitinivibrionales bacterium]|nr:hypothetical protein [Chitinivibrionales bacterium]
MIKPILYTSTSTDIFFHQAFERYLLEQHSYTENQVVLYLWSSDTCAVIGKHQNIWSECDTAFCRENNIAIARRISGGGAVVHDVGNLNLSFIASANNSFFDTTFSIISNALHTLGIEVRRNERQDILFKDRKCSGWAKALKKNGWLLHGTLLVASNLPLIRSILKPTFLSCNSNGVQSVRSEMINCSDQLPGLNPATVTTALISSFQRHFDLNSLTSIDSRTVESEVACYYRQLKDTNWIYGENPICHIEFNELFSWGKTEIELTVENRIVSDIHLHALLSSNCFEQFRTIILNTFFEKTAFTDKVCSHKQINLYTQELFSWLNRIRF